MQSVHTHTVHTGRCEVYSVHYVYRKVRTVGAQCVQFVHDTHSVSWRVGIIQCWRPYTTRSTFENIQINNVYIYTDTTHVITTT